MASIHHKEVIPGETPEGGSTNDDNTALRSFETIVQLASANDEVDRDAPLPEVIDAVKKKYEIIIENTRIHHINAIKNMKMNALNNEKTLNRLVDNRIIDLLRRRDLEIEVIELSHGKNVLFVPCLYVF